MIGKTISHYKILEKIGEGGMGEVYLAEDLKLERKVAIKFLPEHLTRDKENVERFEREAKAAASLNHPNIVTIYEIADVDGQTFIVMEYVGGQTLREIIIENLKLKIEDSLDIAFQLCAGLSEAHQAGIVHRDIKPENIIIDKDARVKILDFGLAKLKGVSKLTKETSTLGTIHYMSPEQLQGKEVDLRSDIWSMGVILYEMLTGEVPFKGDYEQAVMYAILNEEPMLTALSDKAESSLLEKVILMALNKKPNDRYQTINELLSNLKPTHKSIDEDISNKEYFNFKSILKKKVTIITAITLLLATIIFSIFYYDTDESLKSKSIKRLVVLPFENLGSPEDGYFADGITEEITSRLSQLHGLGVISRSSAVQYKNTNKTMGQIGEELDVDYILEGSVRWDKSIGQKGRVIVTPKLIGVPDDIHLWSEQYDRLLENIFDIQIKIAEDVIKALDITVLEPEREELYHHPTDNLEAYDLFIRAREIMNKYYHIDPPKLEHAVQLFKQAIEIDKNLVMAYVWISEIHSWLYHIQFDYTEDRQAKSKAAIDKALEMQPDLPKAKLYLAWYFYRVFRDYDRARELFNDVKKRRPNESPELLAAIERRQGNGENSVLFFKEAFRMDPRTPRLAMEVGTTYMNMRKYKEAQSWYQRHQILVPDDDVSKSFLAKCYVLDNGNINAAQSTLNSIKKIDIRSCEAFTTLILVDLFRKNYDHALNRFDSLKIEYISDQHFFLDKHSVKAYVYNLLGDTLKSRQYADSSVMVIHEEMNKNTKDPRYHSALGLAYSFGDRKNEAISAAKRAIEIYPISLDALAGPNYVYNLAWVYTIIGKYDDAIDNLEYLLSISAGKVVSKAMLRIDPKWNKLRDNPRFQEIIK